MKRGSFFLMLFLLLAVVKEQQKEIETLKTEMKELRR